MQIFQFPAFWLRLTGDISVDLLLHIHAQDPRFCQATRMTNDPVGNRHWPCVSRTFEARGSRTVVTGTLLANLIQPAAASNVPFPIAALRSQPKSGRV